VTLPLCWNIPLTASQCSDPLHTCSANIKECQWVTIFPHREVWFHTFASCTLPRQAQFCQTAPLLLSVTHQETVMEYWWEGSSYTAIPPKSTSDIVGQCNKIGSITFGASLKDFYTKAPWIAVLLICYSLKMKLTLLLISLLRSGSLLRAKGDVEYSVGYLPSACL